MNFTPQVMAFWVMVFVAIYVADIFEVTAKFNLDQRSMFIGFLIGVVLMKFAPSAAVGKKEESQDATKHKGKK